MNLISVTTFMATPTSLTIQCKTPLPSETQPLIFYTEIHTNKPNNIAHLQQKCHNSKFVIFQDKRLKILKFYTFLSVQRRHNCSPAASFVNCVMKLYRLKVHLQTFLSMPITIKILSCDTPVANERYSLHSYG
jgi:hypothetical protein